MPPRSRHKPALGPSKASARDRILAEWRGIHLGPAEKARKLSAKSTTDVMPKLLAKLRIDNRQAEAEIVKAWNELLDPNITAHAQPTSIRNGTLFISVDSSAWLSELVRYRRKEILERLQHCFGRGLVSKIAFRAG